MADQQTTHQLGTNYWLVDEMYREYLDALLRLISERYGSRVLFASPADVARHVRERMRP